MTVNIEAMRRCLRAFDLRRLLVGELGWNHHRGAPVTVAVKELRFRATPIAEKAGFVVWCCEFASNNGRMPGHAVRRQVGTKLATYSYEHMIVFVDDGHHEQIWHWVRRQPGNAGGGTATREYRYRAGQTGELVLQRLKELAFGLDEEADLHITLVAAKVQAALDAEQVTKKFYDDYQYELREFQKSIGGLELANLSGWYSSLMLNRLMLIYFVQKAWVSGR